MKAMRSLVLGVVLSLGAVHGCGDDGGGDSNGNGDSLTPPQNLKATTVEGKPHLTWTDGRGEDHYMIERMDHVVSSNWVEVKGAESLVTNTTQFHDASAVAGKTYMYRVVGMKGESRVVSNEVTWP